MRQQQLPLFGKVNQITYSGLTEFRSQEAQKRGGDLLQRIKSLLATLGEEELKLERAHALLQELNDVALELSALDSNWVEFSDAVFEQIILPSKTSATGAVKLLCGIHSATIERTHEDGRD